MYRPFDLLLLVALLSIVMGCSAGRTESSPSPAEAVPRAVESRQAAPKPVRTESSTVETAPFLSDFSTPFQERATGVVVDPDGRPIFRALVRHHLIEDVVVVDGREGVLLPPSAILVSGGGPWYQFLFTRTSTDGSFVLVHAGSGHYILGETLVASAPGYQRQRLVYRGKPLKFVLVPSVVVLSQNIR